MLETAVAFYNCSAWGRILVSDADRLRFLHNQTTNNIQILKPGQGCETVFVNSTGRTLDLAAAYVLEEAVLISVSPQRRDFLLKWMDKYIFFSDKVQLKDITQETAAFMVLGTESDAVIETLGFKDLVDQPWGTHQSIEVEGVEIRAAVGSGLAIPGYQLILAAEQAEMLQNKLQELNVEALSDQAWEALRIQQGRPIPDAELTEDYNPLEAGLWHTISFTKGCYIGQETIARLNTYRGVKQHLWGLKLNQAVEAGTPILKDEEKIGTLTSITATDTGFLGLGYIRSKSEAEGLNVQVGTSEGQLVSVPYISHEYVEFSQPKTSKGLL